MFNGIDRDHMPFMVNSVCLFAQTGKELEYIQSQTQKQIWTVLDCDGSLIIASGWHYVNSFGYIITEIETPNGIEFEVLEEKDNIIISAKMVLNIAADIMPDIDDGEAQELLNTMREEIFYGIDNTINYRLKELKNEGE